MSWLVAMRLSNADLYLNPYFTSGVNCLRYRLPYYLVEVMEMTNNITKMKLMLLALCFTSIASHEESISSYEGMLQMKLTSESVIRDPSHGWFVKSFQSDSYQFESSPEYSKKFCVIYTIYQRNHILLRDSIFMEFA